MPRYSSTALYIVKHKDTDMYLCERAGSSGRWDSDKNQAMKQLKSWWDENLNPDTKKFFRFERVES